MPQDGERLENTVEDIADGHALAELDRVQEMPGIISGLDSLQGEIDQESALVTAGARERLSEDTALDTIRWQIPPRIRAAALDYERAVAEDTARVKEGRQGPKDHEDFKVQAAGKRDLSFQKERGNVESCLRELGGRYGVKAQPAPAPELLAEVQTGFVGFDAKTGRTILDEAETTLGLARTLEGKERERQNQLLEKLHLPLAQRMAESPPRHSKAWQPAFLKLKGAIEAHLDVVRGGAMDRMVKGFGEQSLVDFDFAVSMAKDTRWDDQILAIGSPSLKWTGVE